MDYAAVLALILKGVEIASAAAPIVAEAIPRLKADIEAAYHGYTGKSLTEAERDQLDADIEALSARLHQPLSPE